MTLISSLPSPLFLLFLLLLCGGVVVLGDLTITTPQEFIDFSNDVSQGTSYSGTTVYLGADLDFTSVLSSSFVPIGSTTTYNFEGTFDGQGHTISNLAISSSTVYTGLFGHSYGTTIKNVVMDSSCSIESTYSGSDQYATIASIIAYCPATKRQCSIEGIVNMASVTHSGSTSNWVQTGGIVGRFYTPNYDSYVKNCVNYGSLLISGTNTNSAMGGIVAGSHTGSTNYIYVQNCLNYGKITHSGTTSSQMRVGGIAGWGYHTYINNCVSAGEISLSNTPSDTNKGGVVGRINGITNIYYSHFTNDVGLDSLYGTLENGKTVSTTGSSTSSVSIDSSIVSNLNTQATSNNWNRWILNTNSNEITFKVNNNKDFSFISKIILLPDLSGTESNPFSGWYTDSACTKSFTSQSVSSATTLYGLYRNTVSVTLDSNGGTPSQQVIHVLPNQEYGTLPSVEREGYSFVGWFTEKDDGQGKEVTENTVVSASSAHTLYAHWSINNYTLTFIFNNSESDEIRILNYSDTINYPSDPVREGYSFNGWDNKDITTMPAHNLNITAQWNISNYTLTFIFNNSTGHEVRTLDYNEAIEYPENIKRKGYTFNGWLNYTVSMPAHNLVVTVLWTPNNYTVTFNTTGGDAPEYEKNVTYDNVYRILPEAGKKEGYSFAGWFTEEDGNGKEITEDTIVEVDDDHTLYAHWSINNYTLTFIFNNSKSDEVRILNYSDPINYPSDPVREGYRFNGWDNGDITTMPAHNLNITAQWTINNYTLRFIFNNSQSDEVRILNYSETIEYPSDPVREGFTFNGWSSKPKTMPAQSITITAQWIEKPSEFVEIVFGKKDLSEEKVKAIVSTYTEEEFVIEKFEVDSATGEIRVIIRFVDSSDAAAEFVRNVNENTGSESFIREIGVKEGYKSFSNILHPTMLFSLFIF